MLDAQINYDNIEMGIACYCYGETTCGQRVFYRFGMSTIPIYNTNNSLPRNEVAVSKGNTTPRCFCLIRYCAGSGYIGTPPQLQKACFVDVYRQTHLGDGVLIKEKLVPF
jgi:hypothetical protein